MTDTSEKTVQAWQDYLLGEIQRDQDIILRNNNATFLEIAEKYKNKQLSEQEVRDTLGQLKEQILPQCVARHHTDKLLSAAIEYIIKPDRKLQLQVL